MRREPTWRIPVGVLALLGGLLLYGLAVAWFVAPLLSGRNALIQLPAYLVLGLAWLLPMGRFLQWMETGRWR